jgi:hypothetical protein
MAVPLNDRYRDHRALLVKRDRFRGACIGRLSTCLISYWRLNFRSNAADNLGAEPGSGLGHLIYLAAIATATIGWLGLIAWVATLFAE